MPRLGAKSRGMFEVRTIDFIQFCSWGGPGVNPAPLTWEIVCDLLAHRPSWGQSPNVAQRRRSLPSEKLQERTENNDGRLWSVVFSGYYIFESSCSDPKQNAVSFHHCGTSSLTVGVWSSSPRSRTNAAAGSCTSLPPIHRDVRTPLWCTINSTGALLFMVIVREVSRRTTADAAFVKRAFCRERGQRLSFQHICTGSASPGCKVFVDRSSWSPGQGSVWCMFVVCVCCTEHFPYRSAACCCSPSFWYSRVNPTLWGYGQSAIFGPSPEKEHKRGLTFWWTVNWQAWSTSCCNWSLNPQRCRGFHAAPHAILLNLVPFTPAMFCSLKKKKGGGGVASKSRISPGVCVC